MIQEGCKSVKWTFGKFKGMLSGLENFTHEESHVARRWFYLETDRRFNI